MMRKKCKERNYEKRKETNKTKKTKRHQKLARRKIFKQIKPIRT